MPKALLLLLTAFAAVPALAVEVGAAAPPIEGPGLVDARPVSLAALRGRVVLVDFWASWCGPCKVSLPEMNALRQELIAMGYGPRFEVIAVNVDEEPKAALKFLSRHPVTYPLVSDPRGRLPAAYQLPTMPSSYLVGADGRIVQVHSGYKPGDAGKLKAEILRLLGAAS